MAPRTLLCCLLLTASQLSFAQSETLVIRPVEIHDVLTNPHMGIQTFQRFNGQPINAGLRWSEEGPTGKLQQAAGTDFPGSTVSYCRWFWHVLEPEQGKVRWDILDQALAEARHHGQTLAIRLMPYDDSHPLPEWYRKSGARRANKPSDKDGKTWQPDFADPLYMKYWGGFVTAAGARYDGHPDLDSVDISTIGYWGEGWSPYMPDFPAQTALIDVYLKAFKRTPLLMNFDQEQALAYAADHGTGWRLDCWGDMRTDSTDPFFPNEMLDVYPQQIVRAGIQDAWQRGPVYLEACWVPGYWKEQTWDLDYILTQALRWHTSQVNIKSSAIPPEWKAKFDEFQKKMGYRFVLRRLEYPRSAQAGTMMPLHMWWLNDGVAPVYRDYQLAVRLTSGSANTVIPVAADVRKWLPGDSVVDGTIPLPSDLAPGNYRLQIGLLDKVTHLPAIKLAIQGRQPDGWYDLGSLQVPEK
jgi:hypothetical protein